MKPPNIDIKTDYKVCIIFFFLELTYLGSMKLNKIPLISAQVFCDLSLGKVPCSSTF